MTSSPPLLAAAAGAYRELYHGEPTGVWSAPGRVNLIGEHTDYNQGFVLPFAIDRRTWCALGSRSDRRLRATSSLTGDTVEAHLDTLSPDQLAGWSAYVFGVVWALGESGVDLSHRTGLNLVVVSDVPLGAGLSSSAALECAVALAINDSWALGLSREELAQACQLAENKAVGAPTGIMDQSASLLGTADHAVLLDCLTFATEQVPLRCEAEGVRIMVIDTHVTHAHATGGYAARRASCEEGAAALRVPSLRALTSAHLPAAEATVDNETYRRIRHIVTENERVNDTVQLLRGGTLSDIGNLLVESHLSMRDDFEISVPELDLAVESAMAAGAIGARMTGGGFGGSAIALVSNDDVHRVQEAVLAAFALARFTEPTIFTVLPSEGARRDA